MKKIISLFLTGAILLMSCLPAAAATNTLTMISSSPVTSGATLKNYTWDISDGKVKAAVLEIDLTDPYVQLEVVPDSLPSVPPCLPWQTAPMPLPW